MLQVMFLYNNQDEYSDCTNGTPPEQEQPRESTEYSANGYYQVPIWIIDYN